FTAFNQADSSISRKYGGTGLGLTICQRLVTLMGGKLDVSSAPGQGSNFSFSLIFDTATAVEHTTDTVEPAVTRSVTSGKYTILLVEDNYFNQALAQIILQKLGYKVLLATSGEQALQCLTTEPVSLVLMDIEMPGLDGFDTTRQLRQLPGFSKLPVIAMTAHSSDATGQHAIQAQMNDLISKPIDASKLAELLHKWLG